MSDKNTLGWLAALAAVTAGFLLFRTPVQAASNEQIVIQSVQWL